MFDFPNTPANGQQVTTPNGTMFAWDGVKWVGAGQVPARNKARLQAQWQGADVVANGTVWWLDMPYDGTVDTLKYFTGNGSFNVAIQIDDVNVPGLNAITVSLPASTTTAATSANTFLEGQRVSAVITGATGDPTDAVLSIAVTWSNG
jgi:hypothetical protein